MKNFILINGKTHEFFKAKDIDSAKDLAIKYADHSKEIIVREINPMSFDPEYIKGMISYYTEMLEEVTGFNTLKELNKRH